MTHSKHKVIAFCPIDDGLNNRAVIVLKHRSSNIVHEGNQCIKLVLLQLDLIANHKGIHIRHKLGKLASHQLVSFLRCYTVFPIPVQVFIGTSGTKTNCPLTVIPERNGIKALHLFN